MSLPLTKTCTIILCQQFSKARDTRPKTLPSIPAVEFQYDDIQNDWYEFKGSRHISFSMAKAVNPMDLEAVNKGERQGISDDAISINV